tara:strand:+ start:140 stop:625 length:486 start_codon:yes stop_codon:yes gene_type:complete
MFGDEGAAMQTWTTGQGVPPGLLNYQIPGGPQANVAYTGGNPGLFDFNAGTTGTTTTTVPQVYNLPGGGTTTDFGEWTGAQHELNYPGRTAAAQAAGYAGLDYWKPGAAEWRAGLPGGATSQDWINMYGTAAQQAAGQTAAEQIAAGWIGDEGGAYAHLFD